MIHLRLRTRRGSQTSSGRQAAASLVCFSAFLALEAACPAWADDNDALYPNVVDRFDESTVALTELTFTQYFGETVALYAGLLDTSEGDENELLGSAISDTKFLNTGMLYSLVEDAFDHNEGRTFATVWTFAHELRGRGGAQTYGFLYGIDLKRTNISADSRLFLESVLLGQPTPTTTDDTWAFYYNAHQYLQGDESGGYGIAVRFGLSDGDPNPVKWNLALGFGGTGLFPQRERDTWGFGGFYLAMSNAGLLQALDVEDELGGELFYNIALTPWHHVTLDAQVIDSALSRVDTTWVLGGRAHVNFQV